MTCTPPLTDPLRHLLDRLVGTTGAPTEDLNQVGLAEARRFGWVFEHQGRVALTGAGAHHAGEIGGGMLGGWPVWLSGNDVSGDERKDVNRQLRREVYGAGWGRYRSSG